jgi:non-homologous end joining protein Ku
MKRHLLAVACIGIVLGVSVAWTQDRQRRIESPTQDLINDLSQNVEATPSRVRDDALREQLLRLVEEKAQLMDREALEKALAETQNDISELQALQKLEEARQILSSIIEEHEGTAGAARARRMLDTDTEPTPPTADPFFNPI